jgi:uncharacterized protein YjeT (DUF2065 family)
MRDFWVVIGLVSAIEGLVTVGFTNSMRARMAIAAREDPGELHEIGLSAAFFGVAIV